MLLFNSSPILHRIPIRVAESVFSIFYRRYCIWPFACVRPGNADVNLIVWAKFRVLARVIDWWLCIWIFFLLWGILLFLFRSVLLFRVYRRPRRKRRSICVVCVYEQILTRYPGLKKKRPYSLVGSILMLYWEIQSASEAFRNGKEEWRVWGKVQKLQLLQLLNEHVSNHTAVA